jgi:release factor glutamine methyltransferase
LARPDWQVSGFDISPDALAYAHKNKTLLESSARIFQADLFGPLEALAEAGSVDILVSNPPYVPVQEASSMAKHVREFEPEIALFAPDEDPLIFYKALALVAKASFAALGRFFAEVHAPLASDTKNIFTQLGQTTVFHDQFDRPRLLSMVKG